MSLSAPLVAPSSFNTGFSDIGYRSGDALAPRVVSVSPLQESRIQSMPSASPPPLITQGTEAPRALGLSSAVPSGAPRVLQSGIGATYSSAIAPPASSSAPLRSIAAPASAAVPVHMASPLASPVQMPRVVSTASPSVPVAASPYYAANGAFTTYVSDFEEDNMLRIGGSVAAPPTRQAEVLGCRVLGPPRIEDGAQSCYSAPSSSLGLYSSPPLLAAPAAPSRICQSSSVAVSSLPPSVSYLAPSSAAPVSYLPDANLLQPRVVEPTYFDEGGYSYYIEDRMYSEPAYYEYDYYVPQPQVYRTEMMADYAPIDLVAGNRVIAERRLKMEDLLAEGRVVQESAVQPALLAPPLRHPMQLSPGLRAPASIAAPVSTYSEPLPRRAPLRPTQASSLLVPSTAAAAVPASRTLQRQEVDLIRMPVSREVAPPAPLPEEEPVPPPMASVETVVEEDVLQTMEQVPLAEVERKKEPLPPLSSTLVPPPPPPVEAEVEETVPPPEEPEEEEEDNNVAVDEVPPPPPLPPEEPPISDGPFRIKIGSVLPDFFCETTHGSWPLHSFLKADGLPVWTVLFTHSLNFSPVATTELACYHAMADDFWGMGVKLIGLSCSSVEDHQRWAMDVLASKGLGGDALSFPLISDTSREISSTLGVLDPNMVDAKGDPLPAAAVFIIGPDLTNRLTMMYPSPVGQSLAEVMRVARSLQLAQEYQLATPANWQDGDQVIVNTTVSTQEAAERFRALQVLEMPSSRDYLRYVECPMLEEPAVEPLPQTKFALAITSAAAESLPFMVGTEFPNFAMDTTSGSFSMYDFIENTDAEWTLFLTIPGDFTPVGTTELGALQNFHGAFAERGVKVISLCCDTLEAHEVWSQDILSSHGVEDITLPFPLIADPNYEIAMKLGMVDPLEKPLEGLPESARALFLIGPDKRVKLSMLLPTSTGYNFFELLRAVDAVLLTEDSDLATPANWERGQRILLSTSVVSVARFSNFETVTLPSGKPYLRYADGPPVP